MTPPKQNVVMTKTVAAATVTAIAIVVNEASAPSKLKAAIKRQAFVLTMDEERALQALPRLAPDLDERRRGFEAARRVIGARGEPTPYQQERLRRAAQVLGLDQPAQPAQPARARKPA